MINVTGIGANVCDTLFEVERYPDEDTKMRADNVMQSGGGPCATGLVAASVLGANTAYIGNLTNDGAGRFLKKDLEKYGVNTDCVKMLDGYSPFTSCILLSKKTSSRTCVFCKGNLPDTLLSDKDTETIANSQVLMVDGNDLNAALKGAKTARENGTKVLYDAGGLYNGVENLLPYADYLIPSKEFALGFTGEMTVENAAKKLFDMFHPTVVVITCGKYGGYHYDGKIGTHYPIYDVEVKDSNGAGDVFHGAFAVGVCKGFDTLKCCHFASAVSALKCTGIGARESVPDYETVEKFMKENGYEL